MSVSVVSCPRNQLYMRVLNAAPKGRLFCVRIIRCQTEDTGEITFQVNLEPVNRPGFAGGYLV